MNKKKQFKLDIYTLPNRIIVEGTNEEYTNLQSIVDLLNEQQAMIKELEKENKRLAKNLKVAKDNVDANFRSAQYWRQKFEAIPKSYTCTSGGFGQNE